MLEPLGLARGTPLRPLTTLELGGPARALAEAASEGEVRDALAWARAEKTPAVALGGGSNVVVADGGFPGLVVRVALRGISVRRDMATDSVLVTAAAGESWDELVAMTVGEGWGGIECLSGIPGSVGATPIQNVGAYGQEVAEPIASVRVLDRATLAVRDFDAAECSFSYRDSAFRRDPDLGVILAVTFRLRAAPRATVRSPELARLLEARSAPATVAAVREAVLELRRSKSMVIEPDDPNRRSVGSFFVNPALDPAEADEVARRAASGGAMPRFPAADGRVKVPAAWLVEQSGFRKGTRRGAVGISSRHSLALVHHGGGTAAELVALACEIRATVRARFGVALRPEPVFLGFPVADPVSAD